MDKDKLEEGLKKFNDLTEDGEGTPATPDSIPGMGVPSLAQRGEDGSGDVPAVVKKNKRTKKVKSFDDFFKK